MLRELKGNLSQIVSQSDTQCMSRKSCWREEIERKVVTDFVTKRHEMSDTKVLAQRGDRKRRGDRKLVTDFVTKRHEMYVTKVLAERGDRKMLQLKENLSQILSQSGTK